MSDELVPCRRLFSNGTEFEYFIETQCEKCKRFRNGKCRIYNACWEARWDENKLPATFMCIAPASWNDTVWDDIVRMRTLNAEQRRRDMQMHVCPLQLDIIERLITRYSNTGDKIYDPFGGIGSTPMTAIKMGRYGIACELNNEYFRDGVGYCKAEEDKLNVPTLFDFMEDIG